MEKEERKPEPTPEAAEAEAAEAMTKVYWAIRPKPEAAGPLDLEVVSLTETEATALGIAGLYCIKEDALKALHYKLEKHAGNHPDPPFGSEFTWEEDPK